MPTSDDSQQVLLFLDDNPVPFARYAPPVKIDLDTTKLVDGPHELRVVARSTSGVEGVQRISFVVRNGPAITVLGLSENDTVSDVVPLTVSAYGSERADSFVITASETPQGVPAWVWAGILAFMGWGAYYLFTAISVPAS
ncbi:cytochrome c [Hymenobacter humi]